MKHAITPPTGSARMLTLALGLGLVTAACHKGRHHPHHGGGASSGGVYSFVEVEPNNAALESNYLGSLAVGETLVIRGYIDDSGFDPFDGFAITTAGPLDVEFFLTADDPFADLDICYYDPYSGIEKACWETSFNPEAGLIAMNGGLDFHLVVGSYFGGSSYTLEVIGRPVGYYAPAAAAGEAPAPTLGTPAQRERAVPFEAYDGTAEPEPEASAPLARARVLVVEADGSVRQAGPELEIR